MINLAPYNKTVTAVVGGLLAWATIVVASEQSAITAAEWLTGATYLAIALGVYSVPNRER